MIPRSLRLLACAMLAVLGSAGSALAHPHVWVTMQTQVMYGPDGMVTGLKQDWTFDEAFTAFALQGLERNKDGTYPDKVLKPLAEVNVTSLKEYGYFVKAKNATAKLAFKDPVDYHLTYENEALTLHFVLPLVKPVPAKGLMSFDIYDPTYFVSFSFADKDPVALAGAPSGCTSQVVVPNQPQTMQLSESFFTDLTSSSTYGAQFANKVTVKCP
ncbi:DUF1007 family protein [Aquabacter sp. P-9]|uniref:DUF1007 family protein n=1 Tax=Aquabacter sediminis TaxID=3029197 RepID=UPI00237EB79E|nr:DUF1007 family protein [Aquabacter sp. P-9]MDE1569816.1 DUF1007 family protein [Aquabacter sp. P-9]